MLTYADVCRWQPAKCFRIRKRHFWAFFRPTATTHTHKSCRESSRAAGAAASFLIDSLEVPAGKPTRPTRTTPIRRRGKGVTLWGGSDYQRKDGASQLVRLEILKY